MAILRGTSGAGLVSYDTATLAQPVFIGASFFDKSASKPHLDRKSLSSIIYREAGTGARTPDLLITNAVT